jgi:hypothetical protein
MLWVAGELTVEPSGSPRAGAIPQTNSTSQSRNGKPTNLRGDKTSESSGFVDLKSLRLGMSPRLSEQDQEHAQVLAGCLDDCPAILVERSSLTIIDGVHRVLAARMLGRSRIAVRFFEGSHEEAMFEAVRSNVTHGKPLSLAEREAAAKRILKMRSDLSNRLVAEVCGLSDKTVGKLRASAEITQSAVRTGRDGRQRPSNPRLTREQIAHVIASDPKVRDEEIARSLSATVAIVRDVRAKLNSPPPTPGVGEELGTRSVAKVGVEDRPDPMRPDGLPVRWFDDRALLALTKGQELAEWLDVSDIREGHWRQYLSVLPLGRIPQLIDDARSRATEWSRFADSLEDRARDLSRRQ